MNRKAQFYLVAAIIIVMVMAGIASVRTYAVARTEPRTVKSISSELKQEGPKIIDYGIYNPPEDKILDFIESEYGSYFLQKTENTNILFVYGNLDGDVKALKYKTESTGDVFTTLGGAVSVWNVNNPIIDISTPTRDENNKVIVELNNIDYEFELKDGENFYFLILQESEGDIYVERN